jgi:hypothetical protein
MAQEEKFDIANMDPLLLLTYLSIQSFKNNKGQSYDKFFSHLLFLHLVLNT